MNHNLDNSHGNCKYNTYHRRGLCTGHHSDCPYKEKEYTPEPNKHSPRVPANQERLNNNGVPWSPTVNSPITEEEYNTDESDAEETQSNYGTLDLTGCYVEDCKIHTNKAYLPRPYKYMKYCRFCNKCGHIEDNCKLYKQQLHEMEEKAEKMNLFIRKKPTCSFSKLKGHTTQQRYRKQEPEYQHMNINKPRSKEHVISMTSDGDNGVETTKIINIEASGTFVPGTIQQDSSGSATLDIKFDYKSLLRHGPQQEKEDSPLCDISESAFKGWGSPLSTKTNRGSTPTKAPTLPPTPPPIPQETDSED